MDSRSASQTTGRFRSQRELASLWRAYWKRPDDDRRNRLVEAYQNLVDEVVGRTAARLPRVVDRGDLLTAANVGLIAAITTFDPSRRVRFEAYGETRIRGALLDELRAQDWLPRPWRQLLGARKRTRERLCAELGRDPMIEELAPALGLSVPEYDALYGPALPGVPSSSPPPPRPEPFPPASELDVLPDPRGIPPAERLTRDELLRLVAQKLTEQEYRIVYLRYWEELSMREIGELLNLSESRVCKIHSRLIERLHDRFGPHFGEEENEGTKRGSVPS
ncbi:MAG: sigma-70 family RNA polymerase sigma factor [Planctomycetota bacterium]